MKKLLIGALLAGPALIALAAAGKALSVVLGVVRAALLGVRLLFLGNPVALFVAAIAAGAALIIANWRKIKSVFAGVSSSG